MDDTTTKPTDTTPPVVTPTDTPPTDTTPPVVTPTDTPPVIKPTDTPVKSPPDTGITDKPAPKSDISDIKLPGQEEPEKKPESVV